jgi:hypothetical protein
MFAHGHPIAVGAAEKQSSALNFRSIFAPTDLKNWLRASIAL